MSSRPSNSEDGGACDAFIEALDGYIGGLISFERLRLTTTLLLDGEIDEAEDMQAALDASLREGYLDHSSHRVLSTLIELVTSEDVPTETPRQSGDLIDLHSAPVAALETEPENEDPGDALKPGMILRDRFTLLEELDSGSMGKVFKAVDRRREESGSDSPWVAIKSITEALANPPNAPVALQKEAANAQRLSHPNIIRVFDFDRDGDHVFMTMELLNGASLAELLNQHRFRPFPADQARSIIEDICRGLIYAHGLGIIHADVKPGNVFITSSRHAKLLDFGISVTVSDDTDESEVYAHTPSYASCEVLEGAAPNAQDDVYSLACVAYRMLAGRRAFDGATSHSAESKRLELKPIEGISDCEWAALQRGTAFRRANRTPDILCFLNEFLGQTQVATSLEFDDPEVVLSNVPPINHRRAAGLLAAVASVVAGVVALWPESQTANSDMENADVNVTAALAQIGNPEEFGPPIEYHVNAEEKSGKPGAPKPDAPPKTTKATKPTAPMVEKPDPIRELMKLTDASLDNGFLLTPAYGSAKYYISEMQIIDPDADEVEEVQERFANLMMLEVMVAIADEDFDSADQLIAETKSVGIGVETTDRYEIALEKAREASIAGDAESSTAVLAAASPAADLMPARESLSASVLNMETPQESPGQQASGDSSIMATRESAGAPDAAPIDESPEILPLSALEFERHVQPKFPQRAADRNLSGWVDLRFLVNTKGQTEKIEIMDSEPKGSFEKAATRAISKWQFKPIMVDGTPAEKFSVVRLRFDAR